MRHFQKEPNECYRFVFDFLFSFYFFVRGGGVGGREDILSIILSIIYIKFPGIYFSLITSSDVKTVKVKKKIISSSEYIFLF